MFCIILLYIWRKTVNYKNKLDEFLQKNFSKNKVTNNENHKAPGLKEVYTEEYFKGRYTEQELSENDLLVDGSFKMLESFSLTIKLSPL